jgi:hypothetical protein
MSGIKWKVFDFVALRVRADVAPTDQAIRLRFNLRHNDDAAAILEQLQDEGFIEISGSKFARKIAVLKDFPSEYSLAPVSKLPDIPEPQVVAQVLEAVEQQPSLQAIKKPKKSKTAPNFNFGLIDGFKLLAEINSFLAKNDVSNSRFGELAMGDRKFFRALANGRRVTARTVKKVRDFIKQNGGITCPAVTETPFLTVNPVRKDGFAKAPVDVLISLIERWSETDGLPAHIAFDLACAALERFEGDVARNGKPRVSAKILRAAVEAGKPLNEFCTELMDVGFALWSRGK